MPRIVEYSHVLDAMHAMRLQSLYFNSGAFGFGNAVDARSAGWICADDSSLRPEAQKLARLVQGPPEQKLPQMLTRAVAQVLPGPVWVMPKSHWAFELDFGSKTWMSRALKEIGIDPGLLAPRTTGDAIEFGLDELPQFTTFMTRLLTNLFGSDFALASPARPLVCTLHHHKQVWWTTTDMPMLKALEQLPG